MDRDTVNIAKAQLGFIDVIIYPAFESMFQFIPALKNSVLEQIKKNKEEWGDLAEEYEELKQGEQKVRSVKSELDL
jgi:hypothetical protein